MIAVRIPKEIKDYKEKLVAGLTLRQLISSIFAASLCIPLYLYGKKYLNEELVSWLVILVALPSAGIGFIKINGMPFEKFVKALFIQQFLYPSKRKFKTSNFFRVMQGLAIQEERLSVNQKKEAKQKVQISLERTFLLMEAEEKGIELDEENLNNLLTVKKTRNNKSKKDKRKKEQKEKKITKGSIQIKAEEIQKKQYENPHYIPSKKEGKILLAYANAIKKARLQEINKGKKEVSKKNTTMKKRRTARTHIPKSTQQTIPYIADYEEGLFEVEPNRYSKCFLVQDINYLTASEEEQVGIFCKLGEFFNYFPEEMNIAFYIDNRIVSMNEQEQKVFYQLTGDSYDIHRTEYNNMLKKQIVMGKNDIQQKLYITVTIPCDNPYEALLRFHKIEAEVITNLKKIGSDGIVMSTDERLAMLHDKFRKGREGDFKVDYNFLKEQGLSSKDYIAPSSFSDFNKKNYFRIEDTYARCMYLNNLPASLTDEFLHEMVDVEFPLIACLNVQPVAQDKGLRIVKKQLTGMEANKIEAEKKAVKAGYSPETISHDLQQSLGQAQELLDDMMNKNQKMFFVTIAFMVSGDTLDDLNDNSKALISKARKFTCQLQNFDFQQEEAFKVILPMGVLPKGKIYVERTLTTESTSIFMPFQTCEMFQEGGFYYGLNQISRNLILCNRTAMKTPSGFILGSSGSGKSFATKREMLNVLLKDNKTGVLVIDPENEYGDFAKAFGGTVLNISASSDCYINPMEMDENYGLDDNDDPETTELSRKKQKAIQKKTDYLMSIIQCMISDGNNNTVITPQQKTIIDRCISRAYAQYLDSGFNRNYLPTLVNLQNELDKEKSESEDGRLLAEGVEYYTRGSMNIFSHQSNLDFTNRFVVFNIRDLGKELKQISLLIVLDFIWNRMIANCQDKIRTYCYVDEIHVLFANDFSARYLQQLYKRGRKYGLVITGITQDVEDLLHSEMAKGMLSNSDFIMMLNQSSENLKILSKMLGISEAQMSYVSRADAGSGLLFAEKTIVPFVDRFPTNSYLYKLMSTKFGEDNEEDINDFISKLIQEQKEKEKSEKEEIEKRLERVG